MSKVVLSVSFDVQQISQRLDWQFTRDGTPVPFGTGANTGLLPFTEGDKFSLIVTGNSHNAVLQSLAITQCHLVCRPILYSKHAHLGSAGSYPPPSPFNGTSAVIDFLPQGPGASASGNASAMQWPAPGIFSCNAVGRWEMSLILTAQIALNPSAGPYDTYRVFTFDPECEVGTGLGRDGL
jgi:hypothetical protein